MKRFVVVLVTLCLLTAAAAVPVAATGPRDPSRFTATPLTPDTTFVGAKSASGAAAQTDPALLGRTDSTPINVIVKYDYDSTAAYAGDVAGLAPTSPRVTGRKLHQNKAAVAAYDRYTARVSAGISARVTRAVPAATIGESFRTVYGGVAAQVPANQVADLLKVEGVTAVQQDSLEQPQTDTTPAFIGATDVWTTLGGQDHAGEGVIVGVIDTGIWPEHPSFADLGLAAPAGTYACDFGDGTDVASLGPAFTCNDKLIGAYAFTQTYAALQNPGADEFCNDVTGECSARDPEGHGTHTASTAAGDRLDSATLYGVDRGPISGIAPGASVIAYRVCLALGCYDSDSVAAVAQAILDGVDVINFSISGGANPYTDPVELAFLDAFDAGISVNASAGNDGPEAGSADHGGPWVTTVGASTSDRFFTATLHLAADGGATFDMSGVTVTDGISSPTPIVLAQDLPGENAYCQSELAAGTATGLIVACERGENARVDKGFNVLQGGAAGMILYNPIKMDVETDNHWLPAIHVDGPSTALLDFIVNHANVTASWSQGTATPTQGDVMAAFSSRGPVGDFIKPDITAPGIQILAGMTPEPDQTAPTNGPSGNLFQAIAGTSMSSPHAAGASALVKAAHPDWTPAEIKSALMTSALQDVVKEDGVTPADPFDAGAGALRVNRAVSPTLIFDESFADFAASSGDPLHRIDLNLPSIDAPVMTGTITTRRTALNVSGRSQELDVSVQAPAGVKITVSDQKPQRNQPGRGSNKLHIKANQRLDFWVTISAPDLPDGQYFGRITLRPKKSGFNPVTIPVAFYRQQGQVTLTHVCSPLAIAAKTGLSHCAATVTNLASVSANASLNVTNLDRGRGLDFTNVSAPAKAIKRNDGAKWSGSLTPALPPQVVSIASFGVGGGYLPLSSFGVAPIAGVGDDTITNFNVPAFQYGGESYERVGVVSNGYLVVGGGIGSDIVHAPQTFPNPVRPNNVIAPFWSDLDPSAAGAIRIATLTDGVSTWLVVDWDGVKNFGGPATNTFQIWLKLGSTPATEEVTISYGAISTGDASSGVNWGAENRDGSSGQNIPGPGPANGSDYLVTLTPPTPGGSATITYDASSRKAGTYRSVAAMTSDLTPGITQVVQTLTVTRR